MENYFGPRTVPSDDGEKLTEKKLNNKNFIEEGPHGRPWGTYTLPLGTGRRWGEGHREIEDNRQYSSIIIVGIVVIALHTAQQNRPELAGFFLLLFQSSGRAGRPWPWGFCCWFLPSCGYRMAMKENLIHLLCVRFCFCLVLKSMSSFSYFSQQKPFPGKLPSSGRAQPETISLNLEKIRLLSVIDYFMVYLLLLGLPCKSFRAKHC